MKTAVIVVGKVNEIFRRSPCTRFTNQVLARGIRVGSLLGKSTADQICISAAREDGANPGGGLMER